MGQVGVERQRTIDLARTKRRYPDGSRAIGGTPLTISQTPPGTSNANIGIHIN